MGPWRIPACVELFKSAVAASRRAKERGKKVEEREGENAGWLEVGWGIGGRETDRDGGL